MIAKTLHGSLTFSTVEPGSGLASALARPAADALGRIDASGLRGRGGAGFPTSLKWELAAKSPGDRKYVVCNADEGEPGTFKDRVILTECPDLLFEGMTIAGYAIGGDLGIVYLRGEYAYLNAFLQDVLQRRRAAGLLGGRACGKQGFNFDIRIQLGAGAYVCGEETALISSCEGGRGDPKTRPPFPAQKGYMDAPTVVNNVETFCCAARIMEHGPGWFAQMGSKGSPGTKLLSVCGDCRLPGVYEVPFGIKLDAFLRMAGAEDAAAVQVGGPSGQLVGPADFGRALDYDDLATGGSVMVFGPDRDLLEVVRCFMDFFVEESCGYCTPCRVGNVLLKERLEQIMAGRGEPADLEYLQQLGATVVTASRCGLGQTSPNPILTSLRNFRSIYESRVAENKQGFRSSFDLERALAEARAIAGRRY
jgi:[NiFe] hydrogenase diaphorase moiety large subunit